MPIIIYYSQSQWFTILVPATKPGVYLPQKRKSCASRIIGNKIQKPAVSLTNCYDSHKLVVEVENLHKNFMKLKKWSLNWQGEDSLLNLKTKECQRGRNLSETYTAFYEATSFYLLLAPENQENPTPFESSHASLPTPSLAPCNNHRFLSKKGHCLHLKLLWSIFGSGGCGKKMEEGCGGEILKKIIWVITSWKRWQWPHSRLASQWTGTGSQLCRSLTELHRDVTWLTWAPLCNRTPAPHSCNS